LKELLILGPVMTCINSKEDILKSVNWKNLKFGEDIEFLSKQKISNFSIDYKQKWRRTTM
jgi:hypothetical protein